MATGEHSTHVTQVLVPDDCQDYHENFNNSPPNPWKNLVRALSNGHKLRRKACVRNQENLCDLPSCTTSSNGVNTRFPGEFQTVPCGYFETFFFGTTIPRIT